MITLVLLESVLQLITLVNTPVLCVRVRLKSLIIITVLLVVTIKLLWLPLHVSEVSRGALPHRASIVFTVLNTYDRA